MGQVGGRADPGMGGLVQPISPCHCPVATVVALGRPICTQQACCRRTLYLTFITKIDTAEIDTSTLADCLGNVYINY